ncbi:Aste57867_14098 [Aphanomyces stellatus]|uniref:Aste57867_14098 protein n=1 Tax=Aphanomyces stellatus TaxID=120398 RepID=A0A485L0G2_9STRA|nr:hypothetical protein As57867_014047 [Aphanomyces stellatus]VFT90926.1 Aste57867_14098 [Aphanomyces stellatus]
MRVSPREAWPVGTPSTSHYATTALGCVYVCFSMASSIAYVNLLNPSFANDLWWINYTATGDQALVVDLYNAILATHSNSTSFDILAPQSTMMDITYSTTGTTTLVNPTYIRRLLLTELTSVDYAVVALRSLLPYTTMILPTLTCWVDLNHEFEMAHTARRQQRCTDHYRQNGAVYLETVLRNQVWADFSATWSDDGGPFMTTIQAWLETVPSGQQWLATTSIARDTTTVAQEVAYWRANHITSFTLQWHNIWQAGITESIAIENALGVTQAIALKSIPNVRATWTSSTMNWLLLNDFSDVSWLNRSLIRSATNSFAQPPALNLEDDYGLQDANGDYVAQVAAFRTTVGPFLAVDMLYIAVPVEVIALHDAYRVTLSKARNSNPSVDGAMAAIQSMDLTPVPPSWIVDPAILFYGGNPMCLNGEPMPYVQEAFNFYDGCASQQPLTTTVDATSGTFASLVLAKNLSIASTCDIQTLLPTTECVKYITTTTDFLDATLPSPEPATLSISTLNIRLMQFTLKDTNWTLVTQPVLGDSDAWAFYGWVMVYDWIVGKREVVSFQGDVSSLVLISAADSPQLFVSSATSVNSATRGIYYLVVYTSVVLVGVALACFFCLSLCRFRMHGVHLFWFNRVVSFTWVGRPLVFVRGITATLVLCTANMTLVSHPHHTGFQLTPRPWLDTLLLASEATWVSYAAVDFFTVLTHRVTRSYAPWSSFLAWVTLVLIEWLAPVTPTASLTRLCVSEDMFKSVACTCGSLQIGSFHRVLLLVAGQGAAMVGSIVVSCAVTSSSDEATRHSIGVADFYFAPRLASDDNVVWSLDKVSCLMAGQVPLHSDYMFDVKLWVLRRVTHKAGYDSSTRCPIHLATTLSTSLTPTALAVQSWKHVCRACLGIAYAVGAVVGCVSYIQVTTVNLSNDLFWATANVSGTLGFTASWWNRQLVLGVTQDIMAMNTDAVNLDGSFDNGDATNKVKGARNFGPMVQSTDLTSMEAVIAGLRKTDGCTVPWIFTQYCFVDFNQRWEMANSAARQERCQSMTANGAVFLDAILRNVDFEQFYTCWGPAFDIAFGTELQMTSVGQTWQVMISSAAKLAPQDEIAVWKSHQITHFVTQWQNFKQIGLHNSYSVRNAYGVSYPFTLQDQTSTFRLDLQTTYKMYWGLANDLLAVMAPNTTSLSGQSLIRSSPNFAFVNTSIESVLMTNGTLNAPLGSIFTLLETEALGPFGSVDMYFIPCPIEAKTAARHVIDALRTSLAHDSASQIAYMNLVYPPNNFFPVPKAWTDLGFRTVGGSLLCREITPSNPMAHGVFENFPGVPIAQGMLWLTSWDKLCSYISTTAMVSPTQEFLVAALILSKMTHASSEDIDDTCARGPSNNDLCCAFLNHTLAFVSTYMAGQLDGLTSVIEVATESIQSLNVSLVQFGQPYVYAPVQLYQLNVLDPTQVEFAYYAWLLLLDWVFGFREAVTFAGDNGSISILTEILYPSFTKVLMAELPTSLAFYLRNAVWYVTGVVIIVSSLALVYVILSRGVIEIWNAFELQRVGAIVWIGRPLLLVRSLTAVALLSTCSLQLVCNGYVSNFAVERDPWYKILLAANEVTWMVAIINDIAVVMTQEYTGYFATVNSILVWLVTVTLGCASPIAHSATINKQCQFAHVDFYVVCTSGYVIIGHVSRLFTIIGVVLGTNVFCYAVTRLVVRHPLPNQTNSIFLYAGAQYLFETSDWIHDDFYSMDRMSAAINGILTIQTDHSMIGLDIKIWRIFRIKLPGP